MQHITACQQTSTRPTPSTTQPVTFDHETSGNTVTQARLQSLTSVTSIVITALRADPLFLPESTFCFYVVSLSPFHARFHCTPDFDSVEETTSGEDNVGGRGGSARSNDCLESMGYEQRHWALLLGQRPIMTRHFEITLWGIEKWRCSFWGGFS